MQRALVSVVIIAVLGVVVAQSPPLSIYTCTSNTPLTGANFCNGVVNYPIQTSVVVNTVDNTAYALYNQTVATLNNTAANCLSSIKTLVCQQNFQKCSSIRLSSGVDASVCSGVQSSCSAPTFPTNVTGINTCIANTAVSVSGTFTVCASSTTATAVGQACRTATTLLDAGYTGAQTLIGCPSVSACNTTLLCTRPNNLGDSCSGLCVTGQAQLGNTLQCLNGVCSYSGKRNGYNCSSNAECLSGNCANGFCSEFAVDVACNSTTQCQRGLYCEFNSGAGKCTNLAVLNTPCGLITGTSTNVAPCVKGFTCVNATAGATRGTCQPNAVIGNTCTNVTTGSVLGAPMCSPQPIPTNGTAVCVNSVCTLILGNQGDACDTARQCRSDLACQYPSGQTVGTCQPASSVSCTTDGAQNCNTNQVCSCASAGAAGTCSVPTTSGAYQCSSQKLAVSQCLYTNCDSTLDAFFPYDGYSCASKNCLSQQNDYYCCMSRYESNFVAPNNAPAVLCAATPTPTPAPTSVTTAAPGTTATPTTTKASSATVAAVSAMTVAFAVVMF